MSLALTSRKAALLAPWLRNPLWAAARAVPSLDLRFADSKSLVDATTGAQLVTFTRASGGTYVDSQGMIRQATTNLFLRSEEFGTWWTALRASFSSNAVTAPNGTLTADTLVEDTTASNTHQFYSGGSQGAGTYTVSIYARAAGRTVFQIQQESGGNSRFTLSGNGTAEALGANTASITNVGGGWYRCVSTYTATGAHFIYVVLHNGSTTFYTGDGTSGISFWGAQLEQSSTVGEYVPTGATINSAPRFDHNPTTGESLGLLVEEQRTNLLLRSEEFATTWFTVAGSIASDAGQAPNGTTTADRITPANGAANAQIVQATTITSGATVTGSLYIKSSGFDRIQIMLLAGNNTTPYGSATFNASTGAIDIAAAASNGGTNVSAAITPVGNGWYRASVTVTYPAVTSAGMRLFVTNSGASNGDGTKGVLVWGAQLEAGAFPTSYIKTEAATATRAADVASITTLGANVRSLFSQFRSPASGTRPIVSLDDNTANERIELLTSGTDPKLLVTDGGVAQADLDAGTITANTTARLAARFITNDFAASVSGGASVLDASGTMPTVDRIRIGRDQAGNYLNGTIARITGWNDPLPLLPPITQ